LKIKWVDIPVEVQQRAPVRFTFRWLNQDRWEGRDYAVAIEADGK